MEGVAGEAGAGAGVAGDSWAGVGVGVGVGVGAGAACSGFAFGVAVSLPAPPGEEGFTLVLPAPPEFVPWGEEGAETCGLASSAVLGLVVPLVPVEWFLAAAAAAAASARVLSI